MTADAILFAFVVFVLCSLVAIAIFTEMRRRRFQPEPTKDHIFRCEKCGFVYTDDADVDRSRCSQCGTLNDAIEF